MNVNARDTRPPSLLALPSYLAGNVGRIGHRVLLEALTEHDLRLAHFAILAALADFGELAQHELAERLDIQRSHLVRYVDALEQRALLRRDRDPDDRRRQRVTLTRPGRVLVARLQEIAQRSQAEFLQALTTSEREILIGLLRRVLRADDEARLQAGARA